MYSVVNALLTTSSHCIATCKLAVISVILGKTESKVEYFRTFHKFGCYLLWLNHPYEPFPFGNIYTIHPFLKVHKYFWYCEDTLATKCQSASDLF
jgi:hypothetical protein